MVVSVAGAAGRGAGFTLGEIPSRLNGVILKGLESEPNSFCGRLFPSRAYAEILPA